MLECLNLPLQVIQSKFPVRIVAEFLAQAIPLDADRTQLVFQDLQTFRRNAPKGCSILRCLAVKIHPAAKKHLGTSDAVSTQLGKPLHQLPVFFLHFAPQHIQVFATRNDRKQPDASDPKFGSLGH